MIRRATTFDTPFGANDTGGGPDPFATTVAKIVREAVSSAGGETMNVVTSSRGRVRILTLRVGARDLSSVEFDAGLHSIATPSAMTFHTQATARSLLTAALVAALSGKQRGSNPSPAPAGEEARGGGSDSGGSPNPPAPHPWATVKRSEHFPESFGVLPPPLDMDIPTPQREGKAGRPLSPLTLGLLAMKRGELRSLTSAAAVACTSRLTELKESGRGDWRKARLHDGTLVVRRVA